MTSYAKAQASKGWRAGWHQRGQTAPDAVGPYRSAAPGPGPEHEAVADGIRAFIEAMVAGAVKQAEEAARKKAHPVTLREPSPNKLTNIDVIKMLCVEFLRGEEVEADVLISAIEDGYDVRFVNWRCRDLVHRGLVDVRLLALARGLDFKPLASRVRQLCTEAVEADRARELFR